MSNRAVGLLVFFTIVAVWIGLFVFQVDLVKFTLTGCIVGMVALFAVQIIRAIRGPQ